MKIFVDEDEDEPLPPRIEDFEEEEEELPHPPPAKKQRTKITSNGMTTFVPPPPVSYCSNFLMIILQTWSEV